MIGTINHKLLITLIAITIQAPIIVFGNETETATGARLHILHSTLTNQDYRLWVYLPNDYDSNTQTAYPVVYGLDFNGETAALGNFLYGTLDNNAEIPAFILVGIGFESDIEHWPLRSAQYTPSNNPTFDQQNIDAAKRDLQDQLAITPEHQARWRSGQADRFTQVLNQEIVPFVKTQFAVNDNSTLLGHSLGGLYVSHLLLQAPQTFDNYWLSSPSLWWHDRLMLKTESEYADTHSDLPAKVFLSVGALESDDMIQPFHIFAQNLEQRAYPGLQLRSTVVPDTNHSSVILPAFGLAMRYFFSDTP